ncbi:acylneuraminate cytidylyltransferase family protein [Candidatus Peregrinibacteria bacterium CG10_big_fil_rev_8_21_14_0_10_42_8]|nr:MAG: acylneuraminate cytidylyltransferase family protein [Candidatus Peregrinibacteria bacterium CG10_big_fil_rev_8_21_14_0_10_42_8]
MEILAIIPARGGSKGIPGKNIKPFANYPLIAWTISASLAAKGITRTVVSTDNDEIKDVALTYGAEVPFLRPENLALDNSQTEPVLQNVLETLRSQEGYVPDAIMLLQPTSPIRFTGTIDAIIEKYKKGEYDSILSVFEGHHFKWKNEQNPVALYDHKNRPLRQDVQHEDHIYSETGSVYITRTKTFLYTQNRLGGKIGLYETGLLENIDIDSLDDFHLTEMIAKEWSHKLTTPE